jgi:hypothetical protein
MWVRSTTWRNNWCEHIKTGSCVYPNQVRAVSLAIGRDGSSGGCIRTVTISEAGVSRDFLPGSSVQLSGEKAGPPPQPAVGVAA